MTKRLLCAALLAGCYYQPPPAPGPEPEELSAHDWSCRYALAFTLAVRNNVRADDEADALADLLDEWHRTSCG